MNAITLGNWTGHHGMGLAPRELEATLHAANDLTQKEIARLMGISPKTVEKRIEDARFKLGAKTTRSLVLEAFKRQIISPAAALILLLTAHGALAPEPLAMARRREGNESEVETRIVSQRYEIALTA
ncbi:LuxR C-terminal-related transcriptional regulator [Pseudomonas sp. LJDD11]|uniref:response regulator transcription factor n=1 Tax=Pseudomonas sp. LJDD11 TaxID=2931984 RepID=UPI00211C6223|nr:sigma factor-like helix-turn-helix DNA-binding protein [Pseudomonas sp. LJDD11]MCQ9423353.1 LuxR C-terminal-related transcriptional regulator [Pseudomonas sp. LJDD11]